MNYSNQRKSGAILSYVIIIINTLIQLLYTPILIHKLGQSEYGLYSLAASIIGYLTVLDLGFGNAIIVFTAKYRAQSKFEEEKKLHGMFKMIFNIIGAIAALIGIILFFNVNNLFEQTMTTSELSKAKIMMLILSFNLFITFSFNIYSSIIIAYERFIFQKIMSILNSLLKPLLMLPLLFLGYKSVTLCLIITLTNIIVVLSNYIYCRKKLKLKIKYNGFDRAVFKVIFGYSIWIFMGIIVDKINWSVDNFILGAISGTIAVSVYSIASILNQMFCNLSTAISGVLLPKISSMIAKKASSEELTNEFIKVGRIQYLIVFLMASGLIIIGQEFIRLWAGEGYRDAYYISLILIIPTCVPLIQSLGISIRQAMNKHKFSAIVNVVVAILNLSVSIPLAKAYGAIGASIGTGCGILISSIINNIYYQRKLGLNIIRFWKEIMKMSIPFVIPWLIILIVKRLIVLNGFANIFVYGGIFTILYIIVSYLYCMNAYEKESIRKIIMFKKRSC